MSDGTVLGPIERLVDEAGLGRQRHTCDDAPGRT